MNPAEFTSTRSGVVTKTSTGYWAFIPSPMTSELKLDQTSQLLLSRADALVGELSGLGRNLPNPELLISPYAHREAVLSSKIEGTQASISDLFVDELSQPTEVPDDVREVRNYLRAQRVGLENLAKLPIASGLILKLHAELMRGVRGENKTPGEFRRSQNWIGPAGSTPTTAPFVPPPPEQMLDAIADWERFVNARGKMPDLVQCALMHERFEAIHPFLDGNGRVGRLLITMFLTERNRLARPLLYVSGYIERNRQEYYDLLQRVRTHDDRLGWVKFFLRAIAFTARQAIDHADQLLKLQKEHHARLKGRHREVALIDSLFQNYYTTVSRAADVLKVSTPTASRIIQKLESGQILQEVTGRSWGRIYVATSIRNAVDHPPEVDEAQLGL